MHPKHILIVGGGFAGLKAALELAKADNCQVSLLSERPTFRYYPTLYHTATGGVPSQSSIPLNQLLAGSRVNLLIGKADKLDRANQLIQTSDGQQHKYDVLILALGVMTNYFGIKGLAEYSYGIKSLEDAEDLKKHLHQKITDDRRPDLNYVIVGGGPTGIELAGALPGYIHRILQNHGVRDRKVHVDLVEAAPKLLPRMPKGISKAVAKRLRKLGVTIYLGQRVKGETADQLMINNKALTSHTVIWTAGVAANPFFRLNNFKLSDHGKVLVDSYLQAEPNIFVLGDNADTPYAGLAQTAVYDGQYVADIIKKHLSGQAVEPYQPKRPIYVIPVGHGWAAVLWGKRQLFGKPGWWLRQLADFIAFRDLEPWWTATEQWIKEFGIEENCQTCQALVD